MAKARATKDKPAYRALQRLGSGGMAELFLAEEIRLDREPLLVVLKRAKVQNDATVAGMLADEIRFGQLCSHPNSWAPWVRSRSVRGQRPPLARALRASEHPRVRVARVGEGLPLAVLDVEEPATPSFSSREGRRWRACSCGR